MVGKYGERLFYTGKRGHLEKFEKERHEGTNGTAHTRDHEKGDHIELHLLHH